MQKAEGSAPLILQLQAGCTDPYCATGPCPSCAACPKAADEEKHGTWTGTLSFALVPIGTFPAPMPYFEFESASMPPCPVPPPCARMPMAAERIAPPAMANPYCPVPMAMMAPCGPPAVAGRTYQVEVQMVEAPKGMPKKATPLPRVQLMEGQPAHVMINQVQQACPAEALGNAVVTWGSLTEINVSSRHSGKALVELSLVNEDEPQISSKGVVVQGSRLRVSRLMPLDKTVKVPLKPSAAKSKARRWLEVTVREVPSENPGPAGPYSLAGACGDPCCVSCPGPVALPPRTGERAYFPNPVPAPPMPCPPASIGVRVAGPPGPVPPAPPPALLRPPPADCEYYYSERVPPAAPCPPIRVVTESSGENRLRIDNGCDVRMTCSNLTMAVDGTHPVQVTAGGDRVRISGDQVEGTADRLSADATGRLVLEGHVELCCHKDGHAPEKMTADKVSIHLRDCCLKMEMSPAR